MFVEKLIFEDMDGYKWIGRGPIYLENMFRSPQNQIRQRYTIIHISEKQKQSKVNNNFYMLLTGIQNGTATFCSVTKSCPTLCDLMNCSMPGSSVLHCFLEFAQIHVH